MASADAGMYPPFATIAARLLDRAQQDDRHAPDPEVARR